jgi:chemotaxis methyl-accepting protein methylase
MVKVENAESQRGAVEMNREGLSRLEKILNSQHHLPLSSYNDSCIKRRLSARIRTLGLKSLDQYLAMLEGDPAEEKELIDTLTISVTSFFRDSETFEQVSKKVLPPLLAASEKEGAMLKVWSAGCSTGEEAYSLAIAFLETAPELLANSGLRIWATDIDGQAIAHAKKGVFPQPRLEGLNKKLVNKYFTADADSEDFRVKPELRRLIEFQRENLLAPGFSGFEGLDLIMCRNLLIYLKRQEQERVLGKFEHCLREHGYLVLGKTEFLCEPYRSRFEHVSSTERIFKKLAPGHPAPNSGGIT